MRLTLEFSQEALNDLEEITVWYAVKNPKVADRFIETIETAISQIQLRPYGFPASFDNVRKYTLRTFPYSIFYSIEEFSIIIDAIIHQSRGPNFLKDRLGE